MWGAIEAIGIVVEAVALVAIFFLDWREYRRQGKDREEQHKETLAQMQVMQRQADAANASAEAAKQNTNLLIDRERARLFVEADKEVFADPLPLPNVKPTLRVKLRIQFHGFTPAFVTETRANTFICSSYADFCKMNGNLVPMELPKVVSSSPDPPLERYVMFFPDLYPTEEQIVGVQKGNMSLYVRGFIKYRDVFGMERETRFNLKWENPFQLSLVYYWMPIGTPDENVAL
jgi:hypothetical protein